MDIKHSKRIFVERVCQFAFEVRGYCQPVIGNRIDILQREEE
jgi:hypothetical protein